MTSAAVQVPNIVCGAELTVRIPPTPTGHDILLGCTLSQRHKGRHEAQGMGTTVVWWSTGGGVAGQIRAAKELCRVHPQTADIDCATCARNGALERAARIVESRA